MLTGRDRRRAERVEIAVGPFRARDGPLMSLDAVHDALRALYGSNAGIDIDGLNRSLLAAQASSEAWLWLDSLLSSEVRLCLRRAARRPLTGAGACVPILWRLDVADQDQPRPRRAARRCTRSAQGIIAQLAGAIGCRCVSRFVCNAAGRRAGRSAQAGSCRASLTLHSRAC